jgi:hypothetical protein
MYELQSPEMLHGSSLAPFPFFIIYKLQFLTQPSLMLAKVSLASDVNGAATKFNVNALGISKAVASTSGESYCVTDKMTRGAGH